MSCAFRMSSHPNLSFARADASANPGVRRTRYHGWQDRKTPVGGGGGAARGRRRAAGRCGSWRAPRTDAASGLPGAHLRWRAASPRILPAEVTTACARHHLLAAAPAPDRFQCPHARPAHYLYRSRPAAPPSPAIRLVVEAPLDLAACAPRAQLEESTTSDSSASGRGADPTLVVVSAPRSRRRRARPRPHRRLALPLKMAAGSRRSSRSEPADRRRDSWRWCRAGAGTRSGPAPLRPLLERVLYRGDPTLACRSAPPPVPASPRRAPSAGTQRGGSGGQPPRG